MEEERLRLMSMCKSVQEENLQQRVRLMEERDQHDSAPVEVPKKQQPGATREW